MTYSQTLKLDKMFVAPLKQTSFEGDEEEN